MDIAYLKEKIKHGENIPFLLSKKKMLFVSIIFIIFACISIWMAFSGNTLSAKVVGIACLLLCGYFGLLFVKPLFRRQMPPVISLNKNCLDIFLNPLNENSPFISIQWSDILNIYIEIVKGSKGRKTYYLALTCIDSAMQNIQNQIKQLSFVSIRICSIRNNIVLLNISSFIDISLSDILHLLEEIHKDLTAERH